MMENTTGFRAGRERHDKILNEKNKVNQWEIAFNFPWSRMIGRDPF